MKICYLLLCGLFLGGISFCAEKQNIVRANNDKYTGVSKYSLATEQKIEGPGNLITNYSKGERKIRVDYFRKVKETEMLRDEVRMEVQLFTDDPPIENKIIILVNEKPTQLSDVRWTLENKTDYGAYRIASFLFSPAEDMKAMLRQANSMGIRVYLGSHPATATFDERALQAIRRFYSHQIDEIVRE